MSPKTRRRLHRIFFALLAFATLLALFYAEENWRGARVWADTRRELVAQGETLDFKDLVPPPIPDEQNLAMAPLFVQILRYERSPRNGALTFANHPPSDNPTRRQYEEMLFGSPQKGLISHKESRTWVTGHRCDLIAWQQYYRRRQDFPPGPPSQTSAEDVLRWLDRSTLLFDELARAVAERPLTRFPVNWTLRPAWGISLPHCNVLQTLALALQLRASARLAAGQNAGARADLGLIFRLREALAGEPTVIASLVDGIVLGDALQTIWEGLEARQWTADDLDFLQTHLRRIDVLHAAQVSLRGERAMIIAEMPEELQRADVRHEMARDGGDFRAASQRFYWQLFPYFPHGWYARDAALGSRIMQTDLIGVLDGTPARVLTDRINGYDLLLDKLPFSPTTMLTKTMLGAFGSVWRRFAQTQASVDMAAAACSLEKYYLDHHAYPSTLAELVPAYLERVPADVIGGAPLHYRLTVDGRYQLYSVGWDGRDGGGTVEWPPQRNWRPDAPPTADGRERTFPTPLRDKGDWVWQYTPAEPPDPPANENQLSSR